jgi:hypothetical protein
MSRSSVFRDDFRLTSLLIYPPHTGLKIPNVIAGCELPTLVLGNRFLNRVRQYAAQRPTGFAAAAGLLGQ